MKRHQTLANLLSGAIFMALGAHGALADGSYPTRGSLQQARQLTVQITADVRSIIARVQGGQAPSVCSEVRDYRTCVSTPGCLWQQTSDESGRCFAGTVGGPVIRLQERAEVPENDNAAEFVLEGLGRGLDQMATEIDQATLAWGTPGFWLPWHKACESDRRLEHGAQAGKTTAQLPQIGLVTPADFDPIVLELQEVHNMLQCP